MDTFFRGYNFVSQHDFHWFFISLSSLSKYHAYCFVGGKCQPLSTVHASSLLVTPCRALVAILWFLVVMYIARSSVKSDPSTPFPNSPNIPLIVTRKRVTLPCRISKFSPSSWIRWEFLWLFLILRLLYFFFFFSFSRY